MNARPEATGRKLAPAAYSVREFCEIHGISLASYYNLKNRGEGPDEMRVLGRVLISVEEAARWRKKRTRKSQTAKVV
jgi:hypothetical protein